ncbi:MAG TPA: DNA sulfur modification protein DndB [Pseudolabrys sp.]|uniref:DNA sulfur modification protein DndB n=1 Tax=Pseudolabrys sp. TaxID=1960880 RepID=UPI002DDCD66C|nr:DNA sulfur modification protein DndB [Pseudolabrys sp.]HEV2628111.1 DNA sulfur modification protein DndB [Pseudolabrys sp.]
MFPKNQDLPTPLGTLDEVLDTGDSSEKPFKVFIGHNLGNRTFLMLMPMHEFYGMSEVANDPTRDGESLAQRKLDPAHAHKLAIYLLKGLVSAAIDRREILNKDTNPVLNELMSKLGRQPYMSIQPLVVNIRGCNPRGADIRGDRMMDKRTDETAAFKVFLSQRYVLWVVDGQHRRMAMEMVFKFLEQLRIARSYPKKGSLLSFDEGKMLTAEELQAWEECFEVARTYCTLQLEVHLGLNPDEERQLFHDLNRLGKKVDTNLALQFDNSNPINLFIKDRLINGLGIEASETDVKNWNDDEGRVPRKDIVAVNAILFLNKTNISSAVPTLVDDKAEIAYRFWTAVRAIPGFGEDKARMKTVAAQPVVLKALAKLVFDFSFSNRKPENGDELTEKLLSGLTDIDLSHDNFMWRYYELSPEERQVHGLTGLTDYLPAEEGGNRDIGSFQGGFMRFGAKHNDIYPIIGDMIRWRLGLPSRRESAQDNANKAAA